MNEHDQGQGQPFADNYADEPIPDYRNLDENIVADEAPTVSEEPEDDDLAGNRSDDDGEPELGNSDLPPQKKYSVHEAFQMAQREKFNAIAENERLKQEVSRLKNISDQSNDAALRHYEENIQNKLYQATAKFELAEESGDVRRKTIAITELNDAQTKINELNRWKADQDYGQNQQQQQYQNQEPQYQPDYNQGYNQPQKIHSNRQIESQAEANGYNWAASNSWFNPNSRDYDPEMSKVAGSICSDIDSQLMSERNSDAIGSIQYFQELNKRLSQVRAQRNPRSNNTQVQNRGLNMKQSRSPVSSVRGNNGNSYNYGNGSKPQAKLTPDQAEFVRINKFDKEAFLRKVRESERSKGQKQQQNNF